MPVVASGELVFLLSLEDYVGVYQSRHQEELIPAREQGQHQWALSMIRRPFMMWPTLSHLFFSSVSSIICNHVQLVALYLRELCLLLTLWLALKPHTRLLKTNSSIIFSLNLFWFLHPNSSKITSPSFLSPKTLWHLCLYVSLPF